jgi:hypothetical protein
MEIGMDERVGKGAYGNPKAGSTKGAKKSLRCFVVDANVGHEPWDRGVQMAIATADRIGRGQPSLGVGRGSGGESVKALTRGRQIGFCKNDSRRYDGLRCADTRHCSVLRLSQIARESMVFDERPFEPG